ncbi:MAG: DUF502 domain-containing protein [Bacteriovoracaceae bacterium]|nr:DUF502 domain-containing protein [Bacteriovoracaceae bacterium]
MGLINRLFWKGIIVVLPVTLTIYLVLVILNKAESLFGNFIKGLIGAHYYIPGLGILVTVVLMIVVGILVSNFITGSVIRFFIFQFEKVPFFKAIYSPLRDLMSLFGGNAQNQMKKVVMVDFEKLGFRTIGLVTREEFDDLPSNTVANDTIAVYIPMSYMLGGFTAIMPRSAVVEVDIPVERAIKLAITGWIRADKNAL